MNRALLDHGGIDAANEVGLMIGWLRKILRFSASSTAARCTGARRSRRYWPAFEVLGERSLPAGFFQTNLISDVPGLAQLTDPNLTNPWGVSMSSTGAFWLVGNNTGVSLVATADGQGDPAMAMPPVTLPGWAGDPGALASPTGTVFNGGPGFSVSQNGMAGPGIFLFATEDGAILGWNPDVNAGQAIVAVDNSLTPGVGPVYLGLALAGNSQGTFLYAADFRAATIDVFDQNFQPVHMQNAFADPTLPGGYVPFNIQQIGTSLYVTYTEQNNGRYDQATGPANGRVDVFDTNGHLLQRLVSGGVLDAPWGVALAPSDFGAFSNDLLVGNFGDGRINAFDPASGAFLGSITDAAGTPLALPGLWSLSFGNGGAAGATNQLYFTAGIGDEQHGLFGSLQPNSGINAGSPDGTTQLTTFNRQHHGTQGSDAYPLPPSGGPSLNAIARPAEPAVAFLPVAGSPLILVPTLLSDAHGDGSTGSTSAAPSLSAAISASAPMPISTDGAALVNSAMRDYLAVPGQPLEQDHDADLGVVMDLAASAPRNQQWFVDGPDRAETAANSSAMIDEAGSGYTQHEYHAPVVRAESEPPIATARTQECLVFLVLAGFGMHRVRIGRPLPGARAMTIFKSLWSRVTLRSSCTVSVGPKHMAATRVIDTSPRRQANVILHA